MITHLLSSNNNPPEGKISFISSDHVRFANGKDVSGHNLGCHREVVIEKNISGDEGYSVTIYNLDGIHPLWRDNVQMSTKRMKIVHAQDGIVEMRGYGYDERALMMGASKEDASFENYGICLLIEGTDISRVQLNIYDRNISIVYLKYSTLAFVI